MTLRLAAVAVLALLLQRSRLGRGNEAVRLDADALLARLAALADRYAGVERAASRTRR